MKQTGSLIAFGACFLFLLFLGFRAYDIIHWTIEVLPDLRTSQQIAIQPMIDLAEVIGAIGFGIIGFILREPSNPEDGPELNRSTVLKLN